MAHLPPAWNGDGIVTLLCTHEKSPHAQFVARARRPTVDLTCELTGRNCRVCFRTTRPSADSERSIFSAADSRSWHSITLTMRGSSRNGWPDSAGQFADAGQSFHHLDLASSSTQVPAGRKHRLNYLADMLQQSSATAGRQLASDERRPKCSYSAASGPVGRPMQGEKPPRKPIRIPPKGIVVRRSSDILAVENIDVAHALAFYLGIIFREPITVGDVVAASAVSRRDAVYAVSEMPEPHDGRRDHAFASCRGKTHVAGNRP